MKLPLGKIFLLFGLLIIFNPMKAQQHEWAKAIKHIDTSHFSIDALNLSSDSKGNVITSGAFNGAFDFNPNNGTKIDSSRSPYYLNSYTNELDSNGNYKWNQIIIGDQTINFASHIDQSDNYYTSVITYSDSVIIDTTVFQLSQAQNQGPNAFLIKINPSKQIQWSINLQARITTTIFGIESDSEQNVYLSGLVNGDLDSIDMDPSPNTEHKIYARYTVPYLLKLDSNGSFKWVKTFRCCFNTLGIN